MSQERAARQANLATRTNMHQLCLDFDDGTGPVERGADAPFRPVAQARTSRITPCQRTPQAIWKPSPPGESVVKTHREIHRSDRIGWLRAAVLGANDGIVSTASLVVGVAAADASQSAVLVAGVAGLVAGAMSMAAGEYISVSSQADTERADRGRETRELAEEPEAELLELTRIYMDRGLSRELAGKAAGEMTQHGALEAHLRDELGLSDTHMARPIQAAFASAGTFALGAAIPLVVAALSPRASLVILVSLASLAGLAGLGVLSARAGGAPVLRATLRVCFWGALAMGITALVGRLFGAVV